MFVELLTTNKTALAPRHISENNKNYIQINNGHKGFLRFLKSLPVFFFLFLLAYEFE